jgi:hypothetical protein
MGNRNKMSEVEFSGEFGTPGWWSRVLRDPDPDAGCRVHGEKVIAWIRIVASAMLLTVPVGSLIARPDRSENWLGSVVTAIALLLAIVVYFRGAARPAPSWLGATCTVFDVTLISAILLIFVLTGQPLVATNSRMAFECYFLALAATCLRYDARLCILSGGLAIAEYLGMAFLARSMYDLNTLTEGIRRYGEFDWGTIWGRVIVLGIASFFVKVIVMRAKDLRKLSSLDRMTGCSTGALRRTAGRRAQPGAARAAAAFGGHARRGPLQGIQRSLRSLGRRRGPSHHRGSLPPDDAAQRRGGTLRRRGVRVPASRHQRRHGVRQTGADPCGGGSAQDHAAQGTG